MLKRAVAHADGSIVQPIYVSQQWARLIAKTPLARLRFHDLRHAHATHLLANGVHPKAASERLGHSKVGITLDLYSHVIPGMQEDAVATVDAALKTALRNRPDAKGSNPVAGRIIGTPNKNKLIVQWVRVEATTRIELVYTVLQAFRTTLMPLYGPTFALK